MKRLRVANIAKVRIKGFKKKYNIIEKNLNEEVNAKKAMYHLFKVPRRFISKLKNSKHKISFLINSFLSSKFMLVVLVIILTAKAKIFYDNTSLESILSDFTIIITSIFLTILICPLLFIKKDKNRFIWIMIYDIFFSILLFADSAYYAYSSNMLSISQILYVKYAEEIGATLPTLLNITYVLYVIDIPILLVVWFASKRILGLKKTKYAKNRGKRRVTIGIVAIILLIVKTGSTVSLSFDKMKEVPYLKIMQVGMGSIYGYHMFDIYNAVNIKENTKYKTYNSMLKDYEKISKYKDENFKENEALYGIAKDKNIIIVQLESVQNFVINREVNGKEITPNLNKFLAENIEIQNFTVQSYSTTADSEYSTLTSLYPLDNGQMYSMYYGNINNDIFKLYKKENYETYYMHGNGNGFWNRGNVYKKLQVDHAVFLENFEDTSEFIAGYLSDELLYKQAVEKLSKEDGKFISFLVTASSHTPFDLGGIEDREGKVSIDASKYEGTVMKNYLEAMNYADYSFRSFNRRVEKSKLI